MRLGRTVFAVLSAVAVGIIALLSTGLVIAGPAYAQSDDTPTCSTGTAVPDPANNPGLVSDCEALLASRDTLAGTATLNWSADAPITNWDGVTIGGTPQRVTNLILADKGLTGEIPEEIGNLIGLRVLNLFLNRLTGEIPSELGKLLNLRELTISWNPLTGDVPEELGNLSNIRSLDLSWNRLTGPIPNDLGSLANLEHLAFQANQLTGEMPVELGNLTKLESLDLSRNELSGKIATELGNLTRLKSLDLSRNKLSGEIPADLGNLSRLEVLRLHGNRFPGCVPEVVRELITSLRSSDLSHLPACTGFYVVHNASTAPQLYNANIFVLPIEEELATDDRLPLQDYVARFFEYFDDEFDFLVIVSNLDSFASQISPTRYAGRHYFIQNDVKGIGRSLFSHAEEWGSTGALHGVIHLSYMDAFSRGPMLHELMHRWANFIVPTGIDVGGHWGFSSANGQLGGFDIADLVDHGDGRYSAGRIALLGWRAHVRPYSPIELYLAGFTQPERVPDLWVAEDGQYLRTENGSCVRADDGDCMFSASIVRTYTIEDIIAEHGERVPNYSQSQRDFRAAAILLVDEDHPLVKWQLDKVSSDISLFGFQGADEYEDTYNFYEATGGRATITLDGLSSFLKDTVPASLPGVPTDLTAETVDLPGIALSWMPPASDGFSAIIAYDLRYIETSADEMENTAWTVVEDVWIAESGALQYTLSGLTADTEYSIQARAVNEVGDGPWSESARATTGVPSICVTGTAVPDPANNPGLVSDCETLLASRDTLAGDATLNWSAATPITQWDGITLEGSPPRVTELELPFRGLSGEIPARLGRLHHLSKLLLYNNQLSGAIPRELGDLKDLQSLWLTNNQLAGTIPPELGSLTNLERLHVSDNNLTGTLPSAFTGLTSLEVFSFHSNAGLCAPISDVFQTWLQNLSRLLGSSCNPVESSADRAVLVELYSVMDGANWTNNTNWLSDRPLREWYGVTNDRDGRVVGLYLYDNQLNGRVPAELGSLINIQDLSLARNRLTGELPAELGSLKSLERLYLDSNLLTGPIPPEVGNLSNLERLYLFGNQLRGEIPPELGKLTKLEELLLDDNQLSGVIPSELGSMTNLETLRLSFNRLTGPIPPELGNLTNLVWLELSHNRLTGCIPDALRDIEIRDFSSLNLPYCTEHPCVTGNAVPDAANPGLVSDCETLLASHDILAGDATLNWSADRPITEWEGVTVRGTPERVTQLILSGKGLNGAIPASLGNLSMLAILNLRSNILTGEIPTELGDLTNLERLLLHNNRLSGPIPDLSRLGNLKWLWLSGKDMDLSGGVPMWLNSMSGLESLSLWGNNLGGPIPDLSGVTGLKELKLQNTGLTGSIPPSLGDLAHLKRLLLSDNDLSGEIPPELGELSSLVQWRLSGNQFTGCVPPGLAAIEDTDFASLGLAVCGDS